MVWTGVNWAGLMLTAYLIGSLPTAYLAGRWLKGIDIRAVGDGNMGAANAYAILGRRLGIAVGLVDGAKGTLAAFVAVQIGGDGLAPIMASFAAVAGHNWPFFLQFRGGRGAATALGCLAFVLPRAAFPVGFLGAIPLRLTGSTTAALAFIFVGIMAAAWVLHVPHTQFAFAVALPVMVGLSHFWSVRRARFEEVEEAPGTAGSHP